MRDDNYWIIMLCLNTSYSQVRCSGAGSPSAWHGLDSEWSGRFSTSIIN